MLVPFTDMLAAAQHDGYAIMAPDFATLHMARNLLEAAEAHRAPLLLSFAPGLAAARDLADTRRFLEVARALAAESSASVGLHLDHATTLEQIRDGIEAGFTSVMIDASREPWEVNVERTRQAVEIAHAAGVHVEAELGHVAIGDRYMAQGSADDNTTVYTDPDRAAEFVALTGVDALAVSVGTIHGSYVGEPQLQFDLLARLHAEVPVPLVLHGASGTGAANIRRAVSLGIRKINLFSEIVAAMKQEVAAVLDQPTSGPIELAEAQARGVKRVMAEWFEISGSAGQAHPVEHSAPAYAEALFRAGYGCSEAVFKAFSETGGYASAVAQRAASLFPGGLCSQGRACGALLGALMAIGAEHSHDNPAHIAPRQSARALGVELIRWYEAEYGSTVCADLLGFDLSDPQQYNAYLASDQRETVCAPLVRETCRWLEAHPTPEKDFA